MTVELSDQGRAAKQRVESLTDDLPGKPYESLDSGELDELMAELEPLATMLLARPELGLTEGRHINPRRKATPLTHPPNAQIGASGSPCGRGCEGG